jgi:ABC-type polysaccharide/polyol phosphate export permease
MQLNLAFKDFLDALKSYRIWWYFAWMEVKQRYRRSVLGPWWITISMMIFIAAMGTVFSRIFNQGLNVYVPFFTAGFLFWTFISGSINEATEVFKLSNTFIKQINLPFNIYIFKHLTRHFIFLCHNFVVFILVALIFKIPFNAGMLFAIPGCLLLFLNIYWISLLVAIISTRYRDLAPTINSCMQVAFFITPISWMPKLLNPHSLIMKLNPLVFYLGAIRNPLLSTPVTPHTWTADIISAVLGLFITFIIFAKFRNRIPYWVD